MKLDWVRHRYVGFIEQEIGIYAQGYSWGIGIKFRAWGVRIMLFRWHLCLSWPWIWYADRRAIALLKRETPRSEE